MKHVKPIILSFLCMLYLMPCIMPSMAMGHEKSIGRKETVKSATQWLERIDNGQYEQSWDEAASLFKENISREKWQQTLKQVRTPLGEMKGRVVAIVAPHSSLPGVPDGHYMVIKFSTSFSHKQKAVKTVTLMLESDDTLRVAGYYIQ